MGHKLDVLRGHCDDVGRDYDEIEKTWMARGNPVDDPDAFLARMAEFGALGISMITMSPATDDPVVPRPSEI